ncbi:MAG: carboxypeptidase-like regulatory domain-containing protein [Pirellulales bacterium]|jgi:hypothetical protein
MPRFPHRAATTAVLLGLAVLAGCGTKGESLYPVKGRITVDGKPADGAVLLFHPESGGQVASATADSSGAFACVYNTKPGIPAGKYKITANWPDPTKRNAKGTMMGQTPDIPDLLQGKFAMRDKSTLSVEVSPTTKELPPIELSTK